MAAHRRYCRPFSEGRPTKRQGVGRFGDSGGCDGDNNEVCPAGKCQHRAAHDREGASHLRVYQVEIVKINLPALPSGLDGILCERLGCVVSEEMGELLYRSGQKDFEN